MELKDYLASINKIGLEEYQKVAEIFQKMVESVIMDIWKKHNEKMDLRINGIPICLEGSAVNTSTAFGFIVEEFLTRQLPKGFIRTGSSTINSAYDFKYEDDSKIELMVNLKVEKNTSSNSGIVAANILKNHYCRDKKPKLYLILKSKYSLDEKKSILNFDGIASVYLESFITKKGFLRSDSRNWTSEFNVLSGRLQAPSPSHVTEFGTKNIPKPSEVWSFINNISEKLIEAKKKEQEM